MTYSDINTLENPLFNSSLNKLIISYSTYIINKHKDLYCDYCRKHIYMMDILNLIHNISMEYQIITKTTMFLYRQH